MEHWACNYIGDPWVKGEHECGHFFVKVQKEQFNLDVQVIDADALNTLSCVRALSGKHPEYVNWVSVGDPQEGDAVQMSHSKHPHHIGVWVEADDGGVLHCCEGTGVTFSNPKTLRLAGWNIVSIKRHRSRA